MVQMDGVSDSVGGGNSAQTDPQTEPDKVHQYTIYCSACIAWLCVLIQLTNGAAGCVQSCRRAVLHWLKCFNVVYYTV
jgi:hypothetical protein